MTDSLGDRMKSYEAAGICAMSVMPLLPIVIRLDGKCFHSFTKGLRRPFDERFMDLMTKTTVRLVDETCARIGYTQSDEITLILEGESPESQPYLGGRMFKIASVLASVCSVYFNANLKDFLPEKVHKEPVFDCRVFNLPSRAEAVNCLIWREQDAVRNSILAAGQSLFSHREMFEKSCDEVQEMLWQKGVNWNDYPARCKRGTYVRRVVVERRLDPAEIEKLPPLHDARKNPNLVIRRHVIEPIDMPVLTKVVNREAAVFDGETPMTAEAMLAPA